MTDPSPQLPIGLPNDMATWRTNLGGLATETHNRMRDCRDQAKQMAGASAASFTDAPPNGYGISVDAEYAQRVAAERLGKLADDYFDTIQSDGQTIEQRTRPLRGVVGS